MPEPKRAPLADKPADETKPTLERERIVGQDVPLEAPTSKGELAEAPQQADRPVDAHGEEAFARDLGVEIRGRAATNDEVRARLGNLHFDDATSERIGDMMGRAAEQADLHGIRDEIGDDEAMRIAAHVDEPVMIAAQRVDQIPDFNRRDDDFGPPAVPVQSTTLPAVIQTLPAFVNDEIAWLKLAQLPGYVVNHIRALGRTTFRTFPCFAEHERKERARGVADPMSTMTILATFPGQNGPSSQRELDMMANWIAEEGTLVETDVLEFPIAFPGYRPEVALLATADDSFLMVRDTIENGAPVEGIYIYHWKGGANAYRLADGRVHLGRLDAGRAADRPQLGAPLRQLGGPGFGGRNARPDRAVGFNAPGPRAVGQIRAGMERFARNDPVVVRQQMDILAPGAGLPAPRPPAAPETGHVVVRRRGISKALPMASSSTDAIAAATDLKRLRELGFVPHSSVDGPGLRFEFGDGRAINLLAEKGKRLIDTTAFRMFITVPGAGTVANERASVEDIVAEMGPAAPSP
jgi:hypothetical protein